LKIRPRPTGNFPGQLNQILGTGAIFHETNQGALFPGRSGNSSEALFVSGTNPDS